MKNPVFSELLTHWEKLRAGRIAPLRSEIDPRQIENVLEHAFILERAPSGDIRFRIAGMRLSDLMGMEIRGMPATTIIHQDCRDKFRNILRGLFAQPEIVELALDCPRPGRASLSGDMLLLPMQSDAGELSRILGCLVSHGLVTSVPHRFTIKESQRTRIVTGNRARTRQATAGFAEPAAIFTHAPRPSQTPGDAHPHLRLVRSGD